MSGHQDKLKAADVEDRIAACIAHREGRSKADIEALKSYLGDASMRVRVFAALTLGHIRVESAAPKIAALLDEQDVIVRFMAAWALGRIRNPSSITPLSRALKKSQKDDREQIIRALGEIGLSSIIDIVEPYLDDPDWEIRWSAAQALAKFKHDKAKSVLLELSKNSSVPDSLRAEISNIIKSTE